MLLFQFNLFGNYSLAEYSADHSALFRRNIQYLRYL
jgi:hypothetical protein